MIFDGQMGPLMVQMDGRPEQGLHRPSLPQGGIAVNHRLQVTQLMGQTQLMAFGFELSIAQLGLFLVKTIVG
ncbi:MAG: hypothetical protein DPW09_10645 [Anaerolineae bacterium]|nr:hypothetical protein [Anaerolineae bacterium]